LASTPKPFQIGHLEVDFDALGLAARHVDRTADIVVTAVEAGALQDALVGRVDDPRVVGGGLQRQLLGRRALDDVGRDVLVEEVDRQDRLRREVPLHRRVVLVGAIGIQVRVAARGRQQGLGQRGEAGHLGVVRTSQDAAGGHAEHQVVAHVEREVRRGQDVGVFLVARGRHHQAERVVDGARRTGRHAHPPGVGLDLGVDDADADVTAPALALQVAHHVAAEGLLVEVEAFQRAEVVAVGQADATADIGVVRIVDRGRPIAA
jgi:hypothetical protein